MIWKQLLAFVLPVLGTTIFSQLYHTTDTVIVGNFIGREGLASVGSVGPIVGMLVGFFTAIGNGASIVMAHFFGSGDVDNIKKCVHTSMTFTVLSGIFLTLLGVLIARPVVVAMKTPPELIDMAKGYIRIYFVGNFAQMIYGKCAGFLRAIGDAKRPFIYLFFSGVSNVVLTLLFVGAFGWGVPGAAWATVISQTIAAAMAVYNLMTTHEVHRLELRSLGIDFTMLRRILRVGLPVGFQAVAFSSAHLIIQYYVNSLGTTAIASCTAVISLLNYITAPAESVGNSLSTFVGQNLGAKKLDRVIKSTKVCTLLSVGVTVFISTLTLLFPTTLLRLFNSNPEVLAMGKELLIFLAPCYFVYSVVLVFTGVNKGAGAAFVNMGASILGICLSRIVWILCVTPVWYDIIAIYASYPISWIITAVFLCWYYKSDRWQKHKL